MMQWTIPPIRGPRCVVCVGKCIYYYLSSKNAHTTIISVYFQALLAARNSLQLSFQAKLSFDNANMDILDLSDLNYGWVW